MVCLNFFGQNIFFFVQIALCLHPISTIQTIGLNVQKSADTELTKQRVSMTSVRHPPSGCPYIVNQATSKLHHLSEKERQPQNHYRLPIMNIASFHYESKKLFIQTNRGCAKKVAPSCFSMKGYVWQSPQFRKIFSAQNCSSFGRKLEFCAEKTVVRSRDFFSKPGNTLYFLPFFCSKKENNSF